MASSIETRLQRVEKALAVSSQRSADAREMAAAIGEECREILRHKLNAMAVALEANGGLQPAVKRTDAERFLLSDCVTAADRLAIIRGAIFTRPAPALEELLTARGYLGWEVVSVMEATA